MTVVGALGVGLLLLGGAGYWYLFWVLVRRGARPSFLIAATFPFLLVAMCWRQDLRDLRAFASIVVGMLLIGLAAVALWESHG
jgi:hypothetical protein